jgi:MFS family permease
MQLSGKFWRFWSAAVAVNLGDGIRLAAFPLVAASLTDDAFVVAAVAAATTLPWLLTGPIAGAWADRYSARALLASADALRLGVLAMLIVLILADAVTPTILGGSAFLIGVGEAVRDITAQTVVPRLVPTSLIERANGRLAAGEIVANEFIGPLAGGLLFAVGAAIPFVANSAVLIFAILLVLGLPALALRVTPSPPNDGSRGRLSVGLRWVARHAVLRSLVVVGALVALADSAWFAVFVVYVQDRLDLGATAFGGLLAVGAAGGLSGSLLADRMIGQARHRMVILGGIAAAVISPALLLIAPSVWLAAAVVLITSAGFGVFNVAAISLRHRLTPPDLLGRVVAVSRTAIIGAAAFGALAGGVAATAFGLDAPLVLAAVLGVVAFMAWLATSPPHRAFGDGTPAV